jgi:glycosyltransferase involved in cell wall biosynthesis
VNQHGNTGFLHEVGDVDAMAASGLALLTDPALHARIARAAMRSVRERFCAERVVPMYEAYYRSVSSQPAAGERRPP